MGSNHPSEDHEKFDSLADAVRAKHPNVVRSFNMMLHEKLFPDQRSVGEPPVKEKPKGRPKGSSTKRDPSGWEYMGRGRGRKSSGSGSRASTQSMKDINPDDGEAGTSCFLENILYCFISSND